MGVPQQKHRDLSSIRKMAAIPNGSLGIQSITKSWPNQHLKMHKKCTRLPHPRRQSFAMPSCNVESARFCAAVLKTATTTSPGDNPQPAIHTNILTSELTSSQERYQSFKDA